MMNFPKKKLSFRVKTRPDPAIAILLGVHVHGAYG